jgi:hypothetical protein
VISGSSGVASAILSLSQAPKYYLLPIGQVRMPISV